MKKFIVIQLIVFILVVFGLHYAGFGEPLSKEQLKKLSIPMGKR